MKPIKTSIAIVAILCLSAASCIRLDNPFNKANDNDAPPKFVPYEAEYISVPEGSKSVIYNGNTVVATCYSSGYVVLPKIHSTKALSDYNIVNLPSEPMPGIASENTLDMVVAFEDTKSGDHDYNDLIFQAHMTVTNSVSGSSSVRVTLTPIAMGASITLGLGLALTDIDGNILSDKKIADDCRGTLFWGDEGFINTGQGRKRYNPVSFNIDNEISGAVAGISWYLVSRGQRLYASNYHQTCIDNDNMPQGLVLMNLHENIYYKMDGGNKKYCGKEFWQYPLEAAPISEVYPGYEQAFIEGGDFSIFATPSTRYFDAIAADEDGWLSSDCLYSVYSQD